MRKIRVVNRQKLKPVNIGGLVKLADELRRKAAEWRSACADLTLDIVLVDDIGSEEVNRAALGHRGATDVITIPYDAIPGDPDGANAEIFLNVELAQREASARGIAASGELALYLAHAMDHLCGFNDDTTEGRRMMRKRELEWLNSIPKEDLFASEDIMEDY